MIWLWINENKVKHTQIISNLIAAKLFGNSFQNYHAENRNVYPKNYLDLRIYTCDASRDLVPSAQFKKHEKHQWKSVTFK